MHMIPWPGATTEKSTLRLLLALQPDAFPVRSSPQETQWERPTAPHAPRPDGRDWERRASRLHGGVVETAGADE